MRRGWQAWVFVSTVLLGACNAVFDIEQRPDALAEGTEAGPVEAGSGDESSSGHVALPEASCTGAATGDPDDAGECTAIPKLGGPDINPNGVADEYCRLPSTTFAVLDGGKVEHVVEGAGPFDEVVRFFVGRTDNGIAVHVHVDDENVLPNSANPQEGDSVVVYFSMGTDAGANAFHVIASPPTSDQSLASLTVKDGVTTNLGVPQPGGRLVEGGYEIEFFIPKDVFKAAFLPNAAIRFDLGVNVRDNPASQTAELRSTYYWRHNPSARGGGLGGTGIGANGGLSTGSGGSSGSSGSSGGTGPAGPTGACTLDLPCDVNTWCTSKLGP